MGWTTERKIVGGFAAALVVLGVIAGVAVHTVLQLVDDLDSVAGTHEILETITKLDIATMEWASDARSYIAERDQDPVAAEKWLDEIKEDHADVERLYDRMADLTSKQHVPEQTRLLAVFREMVDRRARLMGPQFKKEELLTV